MALTNTFPGVTGLTDTTELRKNLAGLIAKDTSGVARAGVFPAHTNALVSARSDMNVDIAVFQGAAVQFGGPVLIANDAVANLPSVLVSPGAGTNYYVIYAKQNESTAPGTDANTNVLFGAQLSTTSFAVARAALPTGALELGTVQMPTGKTATNQGGVTISATHPFTAAAGAPVLVRNSTELAAWSPGDGNFAYQIDEDAMLLRRDGAWTGASFKRSYVLEIAGADRANLASMGTVALPSLPFASRAFIRLVSVVGFSATAGAQLGANITTTAGTLTDTQSNQQATCTTATMWYPYAHTARLDRSASTAATVEFTFSAVGGAQGWLKGQVEITIYGPGEY